MCAWGYEFYLLVIKVSLTRERYFQHEKIKFVSPSEHVISLCNSALPAFDTFSLPATKVKFTIGTDH